MDLDWLPTSSIRATASAVLGGVGGLFASDGPVHRASLVLYADSALPGGTELLTPGSTVDALVRMGVDGEFRTLCLKVPDAYGPGRDQDFLLASSADGIPFHHAVLPAQRLDSRLFSSLWLYLAGIEPVVFGLRAEKIAQPGGLSDGDRFDFLISSAVGRFRSVGSLTIEGEGDTRARSFAGTNTGGGLRALPPALFYRG
ncbi:MAG: hypothetical protein M3O32_12630 [Actinomycetota bacterium]|nr:hypothetical protein [Actinomycetota bacterium]